MPVVTRKGNRGDLPSVLQLIRDLAEYERAPDEVEVTLSELEADGFGKKKMFDFFVSEHNGDVVGMALYYVKYSTWKGKCIFLEDIIVKEDMRDKGIGAQLFAEVVRVSKEMGVKRMEWQVLDWNEPAIKFYKKYNTIFDDAWVNGKLGYDQIQNFNFQD